MNIIKNLLSKKLSTASGTVWYKSIFVKTSLLTWGLIILTLLIFIIGTLPYQQKVHEERMQSEANDIAGSIGQVTATAIINNDYGFTVDHCLKIINQSSSILYIIIIRKDGFALVLSKDRWRMDHIKNSLELPDSKSAVSTIVYSSLVKQRVFHYSYPFSYSGINWGRINVGLSLKKYDQNLSALYYRTGFLAVLSIIVGLFASMYFARMITKPILQLDSVSQKVARGDLSVRANIYSENEFGRLAYSFNKMTESLKSSQEDLERKVEGRTAELAKINKILQIEINEKLRVENRLKQYNTRLEALDKIYRGIISAKSVNSIITETISNMNSLFPFISKSIVALFSKETDVVLIFCSSFKGSPCEGERGNKISVESKPNLFSESLINTQYSVKDLYSLKRKNQFEIQLSDLGVRSFISTPLKFDEQIIGFINVTSDTPNSFNDDNNKVLMVVANQLAVAVYQAQLQVKLHEHTQSLQNSLREKEVLLKEIHHRVKNNLQVISSLLYLNSKKIKDTETQNMFKDSQNRVKSIALVHERLYQSKDLGKIDFKEYVTRLTKDLFRSYAVNPSLIKLTIDINDIFISIDTAVPCGLIINEIISNAFKYAFPNPESRQKNCEIKISFNKIDNNILLMEISDNGIGLPEGIDVRKSQSLGLQLVDTLIDQLEGILEIDSSNGTAFKFKFKDLNT